MRTIILFALIIFISGCASASQIYLPSGDVGYMINCSGAKLAWSDCAAKAGDICKSRGYNIISSSGDKNASNADHRSSGTSSSAANRSLIIKCKEITDLPAKH